MTEKEKIQSTIDAMDRAYKEDLLIIVQHHNSEDTTRKDYKSRQIYELMQNADDAFDKNKNNGDVDVKFTLDGDYLIVQNSGIPFSARGIGSLMHPDASSKYSDTIGCKGLGFRSMLNWSNEIMVITKEFTVKFSEDAAKKKLEKYRKFDYSLDKDDLNRIDRIAILSSAELVDDDSFKEKYLEDGYDTSLVFKCFENEIEGIQKQLCDLKFEELLFLNHITKIDIQSPKANRTIVSVKSQLNPTGEAYGCLIEEEGQNTTSWKLWKRSGELGNKKRYELALAYNDVPSAREELRKSAKLYSFFKTEIPMPLPFLVHGTFELKSERNGLVKDDEQNKQLVDLLIDFICEKAEQIAKDSKECDYEALKMAIPNGPCHMLDDDYSFSKKLEDKIRDYKVFPTVNNVYDDAKGKYYINNPVVEFLFPERFPDLLKLTDDEAICHYLRCFASPSYGYMDLVSRLNIEANYYVENKTNSKIIKYIVDAYAPYSNTPLLMTDSNGDRVEEYITKLFTSPSSEAGLNPPEWCTFTFVDRNLEERLKKEFDNCEPRELTRKLSAFNLVEFSFDRVFNEIKSQAKGDIEREKDVIKWLYNYWKANDCCFETSISNTSVPVLTRNGEISRCEICYFGSEYGNEIGERILSNAGFDGFVAGPNELGIGAEAELLAGFLEQLRVSKFPVIHKEELSESEMKEYVEHNSKVFTTLEDSYGNSGSFGTIFDNRISIKVDYISGLEDLLLSNSFEDILYWVLNDSCLSSHILNDREGEASLMSGYAKGGRNARSVSNRMMRSWLRKIFTETEFIPTKSGKKADAASCTIKPNIMDDVIGVVKIDYNSLSTMCGSNVVKRVESILESLGVCDELVDLPKEKIYDVLLRMPQYDKENTLGKKLYTQLNLRYKDEELNKLLTDNASYERFKRDGYVLCVQNGVYSYKKASEVYYVDKKIYCDDFLDKYPKLALGRRAGENKISKMFCVKKMSEVGGAEIKDCQEHPLSESYFSEFKKILPYIYAKRVGYDSQKRSELSKLKSMAIKLVTHATIKYEINSESFEGTMNDYEVIYNKSVAYVKVPSSVQTIEMLKAKTGFISAIAEILTTTIDVEGDKDAFLIILRCASIEEIEEYFKDNGDIELNVVQLAKNQFNDGMNNQDLFWSAIREITESDIDQLIDEYASQIDFGDLSCKENMPTIIRLFRAIGKDISNYNGVSYNLIRWVDIYKKQLSEIINKYRDRYRYHILSDAIINDNYSKKDFEKKIRHYGFIQEEVEIKNSVSFDPEGELSALLGVQLSSLPEVGTDFEELLHQLKEEENIAKSEDEETENGNEDLEPSKMRGIDYKALAKSIEEDTDGSVDDFAIEASKESEDGTQGRHPNKGKSSYSSSTNQSKEEDGFIAEAKVFATLKKRLEDKGEVEWVSGNAEKSGAIEKGDDTVGYDMKYSDENGVHYVEVKGSQSPNIEFHLSINEYHYGAKYSKQYEVWYVPIKGKKACNPIPLGNILHFENGETFLNNSKFSVEESEFKIKAKIVKNK